MTSSLAESPLLECVLRGVPAAPSAKGLRAAALAPECALLGVAEAGPERGLPVAGLECSLRGPEGLERGVAEAGPDCGSDRGVADAGPDLGVVVCGGALPDGVVSAGRPSYSLFTGVDDIGGALPDGVRSPLRVPDALRGLDALRIFPSEARLGTGEVGVRLWALRMLPALRGLDALRGFDALRSPEALRGFDALRGLDIFTLRVWSMLGSSSSSSSRFRLRSSTTLSWMS